MRHLWTWDRPDDALARVPRTVRGLIAAAFALWLAFEDLARLNFHSWWELLLWLATTAVVLASILGIWLLPLRDSRRITARFCLLIAVSGLSLTSVFLLGTDNPGQVGVFVALITASAMGVAGIPVAVGVGVIYAVAVTLAVQGRDPGLRAELIGGALLSVAAAYLVPFWSRYVWTVRESAAATRERERLAREMHDVLAHTLSGLTVKLEATRLLAERRPGDPAVAEAVADAHELAREGLLEARRAVSALRGDVPGPAQLERLLHDFEVDSGIRCRLDVEGTPVMLKPEAQLALYRTAQEALTNIRKHADATSVVVRLAWSRRSAELTVEDAGTPKRSLAPGGYGLSGIRERAALVGGSLEAGPIDGGFRVRLRVPA